MFNLFLVSISIRGRLFRLSTIALLVLSSCTNTSPIERVARRYDVPVSSVVEMLNTLNLSESDMFYNGEIDLAFPTKYISNISGLSSGKSTWRKSDLIHNLRGYKMLCRSDNTSDYDVLAFFYSTNLSEQGYGKGTPLLIRFLFTQPLDYRETDPYLKFITVVNLSDESINPLGNTYYQECVRERSIQP